MTQKQLAALAVRVLAIYAIIISLGQLQSAILLLSSFSGFVAGNTRAPLWQIPVAFSSFAAYVAAGVLLWCYADKLALAMSGNRADDTIASRLTVVEILAIGFCLLGVWTALSALPRITQSASMLFLARGAFSSAMQGSNSLSVNLVGGSLQIAIGAALFFNARKLADKIAAHYQLSPPVEAELS